LINGERLAQRAPGDGVLSWFVTFLGRGPGQMAITERWVFA
jgi:hypothetical protein